LIVAILLLVSQIGLTFGLMYLRRNKQNYIEQIVKQDCLLVDDKSTPFLCKHFLNKRLSILNEARLDRDDMNTSRGLKSESIQQAPDSKNIVGEGNELRLRENVNNEPGPANISQQAGEIRVEKSAEIKIYNNFVDQKTNREGNEDDKIRATCKAIGNEGYCIVTMRDYELLGLDEMFVYDRRTFSRYLLDNLVRRNLIVSIFFKHSLIDPCYIRIAKVIFGFSLIFGINAIFLSLYIPTTVDEHIAQVS
jgi:hypothetical protein